VQLAKPKYSIAKDLAIRLGLLVGISLLIVLLTLPLNSSRSEVNLESKNLLPARNVWGSLFLSGFVNPMIETLLFNCALSGLENLTKRKWLAASICSVIAGVMHASVGTIAMASALIAFMQFSACFYAYRNYGWWPATLTAGLLHCVNNIIILMIAIFAIDHI
jgi:membrane protease YdiL (CAAX protease family)